MDQKTRQALEEILLTVDGKGKAAKRDALMRLLNAEYNRGLNDGSPDVPSDSDYD